MTQQGVTNILKRLANGVPTLEKQAEVEAEQIAKMAGEISNKDQEFVTQKLQEIAEYLHTRYLYTIPKIRKFLTVLVEAI